MRYAAEERDLAQSIAAALLGRVPYSPSCSRMARRPRHFSEGRAPVALQTIACSSLPSRIP